MHKIEHKHLYDVELKSMEMAKGKSFLLLEELSPDNLSKLQVRNEQKDTLPSDLSLHFNIMDELSKYNVLVSYEGSVLFAGGMIPIWGGVAEGWLVVDKDFKKSFNKAPKLMIKSIREYFRSLPYTRIQTVVRSDFPEGHRFIKILGFKHEGIMRKYGMDGYDYHRYSIINEETK